MKIFLSSRERAAGVFIVLTLALVVLFVVGAALRNRWFSPRVRFHADVVHGEGLREGSPIYLSGVEVGEVGKLKIQDDERVDLELAILAEHAHRIRQGTRATARRLFGIGEKRIHLSSDGNKGPPLHPGAKLPMDEPLDLLDAVATLDLGRSMQVFQETLTAVDRLLAGLNENDRFERMVTVLDRAGPTLDKVDGLLTDLREPLVSLVGSPELRRAISGLDSVLNDPATRKTLQRAAEVLAPERLNRLLARTESVLASVDSLAGENGALRATLGNTNRLLSDGRADRLINSLERLTDEQKLGRIIDNTAVIAEQVARIGPDIPALTREMALTLREAVVVLKALQQTWILEGKAEKARRELERSGDAR